MSFSMKNLSFRIPVHPEDDVLLIPERYEGTMISILLLFNQ